MVQRQVIVRDTGHQALDELDATDIPALAYDAAGAAATATSGAASALSTHAGAADPHTVYALESALGTAAAANTGDFDAAGAAASAQSAAIAAAATDATTKANAAQAAAIAASQPVDSDLTAIAALTTTSYGRAFLALADAAAGRTALGLGTASTSASGDFQPIDSDLTAIAALTTTSYGRSLLEAANAAALRTLAGLGTLATQSGTFSGTSSGTNTGDQTLPTRASLGLDTTDSPQFAGVNVGAATDTTITRTGAGDIAVEGNGLYRAGGTDVPVADGGTGSSTAATARTALGVVNDPWTEVVKSADQTVTNSATLVDDSQLKFTAVSGGMYHVELYLIFSGNDAAGDYRCNYALPTATGWQRWGTGYGASDTTAVNTGAQLAAATSGVGGDYALGADGAGDTPRIAFFELWFRAGANADFQFKFANYIASGGRTSTTRTGSVLRYRRLV